MRDAVAQLDVAQCHGAAGCARGEQGPGWGWAGSASQIHNAVTGEAGSGFFALLAGAASRLNIFSAGVILAVLLAGIYALVQACFIIRRANRKRPPESYGYDRFYQALIRNSRLPIAILGGNTGCPISFCGGTEILQECLAGPDAAKVARALDALLRRGIGFELVSRGNRDIVIYGTPVGRSCAVYFSVGKSAEDSSAILDALDAIPVPMWVRRMDRSIVWANKAFASLSASGRQGAAENWEGGLATEAFDGTGAVTGMRSIVANDQPHHFQMHLASLPNGGLAGVAADVADMQSVEKRLQRTAEVFAQFVEHTPFAMAIFDSHQKLSMHNGKYAALLGLPERWLQSRPSKGAILDRLRDERKLPEQKDFQKWKRLQLQTPAGTDAKRTELWHFPGGKSLRIATTAFSEGGQLMMLEDISERLSLEASLNRLSQVQKATIDALEDAVAIFGPDGRLMLHNSNFEALWRLAPAELCNRPHCTEIARICDARMGRDEIWQAISGSISAMAPATAITIHEVRRENGHLISLTLSRLPDGMTMAVFSDFSDLSRFEAMQEEDRALARDLNSRLPQAG